jgi:F-type H+-transporting ATPase subunit epsilon
MSIIKLSIVTPTGEIFNDDIKSLTLPGKEGEFGVLEGHSSLVSSLTVGVIVIEKIDSTIEAIAINWGYVNVSESTIDVLVDSAISLNPSDSSIIAANIKAAKELVNSVQDSNVSIAAVNAKISSFE